MGGADDGGGAGRTIVSCRFISEAMVSSRARAPESARSTEMWPDPSILLLSGPGLDNINAEDGEYAGRRVPLRALPWRIEERQAGVVFACSCSGVGSAPQ